LVLKEEGRDDRKNITWLCRCECGSELVLPSPYLRSGDTQSCGCLRKDKMSEKALNLLGQVFGRLTVVERAVSETQQSRWLCLCTCGKQCIVLGSLLNSGHTKSCGCLQQQRVHEINTTHGMSSNTNPLYIVWKNLKQRCDNENRKGYKDYGGRGITYTDKWRTFEGFFEDMGEEWKPGLMIDRVDNEKGYCKENCRWTTRTVQNRNRRNTRIVCYCGDTKPLAEWCDLLGLDYNKTLARIDVLHWTIEDALKKDI